MKLLKCSECKMGMSVKLTNPDPAYRIDESNPKVGTEYECVGTVDYSTSYTIHVQWSNGTGNSYQDNELSLVDTGIYINIWDEI